MASMTFTPGKVIPKEWLNDVNQVAYTDVPNNITNTNNHIANTSNPHNVTKSQVGLGNVDNTSDLQKATARIAMATTGTSEDIIGTFSPAITSLYNGMTLLVRATTANTTGTVTFTPNSGVLPAIPIVKWGNTVLLAGDIYAAGHWLELTYDLANNKWILLNPVSYTKQIQSISASVAGNALLFGLNPTILDFRSPTLTSGGATPRTTGALSLTVPSGATLGTISGQLSRLVLLAIDNAGTVELAVVNMRGPNNLDETTLISTTAIIGSSNAPNVIYSTTARSNVPFRVVGCIEITEATAGTWATSPTLVQGQGGQALAAMQSFGYGQTYQALIGSRSSGTNYYNTTGRPIYVFVLGGTTTTTASVDAVVNGTTVASSSWIVSSAQTSSSMPVMFVVPPNHGYSVAASGTTLSMWNELR